MVIVIIHTSVTFLYLLALEAFWATSLLRIAHFHRLSICTSDAFSILIHTSDTPILILTSDVSH
jgi:hypothetical protein